MVTLHVRWDELCAESTWPLSLLFSLKSCSAAEQKATSRRPSASGHCGLFLSGCSGSSRRGKRCSVLSSSISVCCHVLFFYMKINTVDLKVAVIHCDPRMSHVGHTGSRSGTRIKAHSHPFLSLFVF